MSEPVELRVRAGDCPCPGSPHTEEIIYLEPELTDRMGAAAMYAIKLSNPTQAEMMAAITEAFMPLAIRSWTFVDDDGAEVRHTVENVERLVPWTKGGVALTDRLYSLYAETLMVPFYPTMPMSSGGGRTENSTHPTSPTGLPPHVPSRRSSRNGSAGKPSEVPVP